MYRKDRAKVVKKNEIRKQFNQKVHFLSKFLPSSPSRLIASSPYNLITSKQLILALSYGPYTLI